MARCRRGWQTARSCTRESRLSAVQLHMLFSLSNILRCSEANTVDHSCAMLVASKCTGIATEVTPSCTGTSAGPDAGKTCDLDPSTDDTDRCPYGCQSTGQPSCTGSDDGSGTPATCTGTGDDYGDACALNDASTACALDGGDCVFVAAIPGAACTLNSASTDCEVRGGDCVYALMAYTPACDFDPNTDGTSACPAGCASTSDSDPCQQNTWRSFGSSVDRYCVPAAAADANHPSSCTVETCDGVADEVAATCTGSASGGKTCDLDPSTDGTALCPAGCDSTAAFTPICDLDISTDGTDLCPAGCFSDVLTDGVPTETWRCVRCYVCLTCENACDTTCLWTHAMQGYGACTRHAWHYLCRPNGTYASFYADYVPARPAPPLD